MLKSDPLDASILSVQLRLSHVKHTWTAMIMDWW